MCERSVVAPADPAEDVVVPTHDEVAVVLRRIPVAILEMEDVLFHLNSAVMMPSAPAGASSHDGDDEALQAQQERASGVAALALVYRQFEFDPGKRILVVGHTDTSGGIRMNFELSQQRADGVAWLLVGNGDEWAEVSATRHTIEDYKQIMQYFAQRNGWDCNPGEINNHWNDATETAVRRYFARVAPDEDEAIVGQITSSPQKAWPARAWRVTYDLYEQLLCETLAVDRPELWRRQAGVFFLSHDQRTLACGESFPIDDRERDNYRSQRNRRVEILFFNRDDDVRIECPDDTHRVHTEDECPLRDVYRIRPGYIDPNDMHAVAYHMRFKYYDRVKNETTAVPAGLRIRVFRHDETEVPSRSTYNNGVYTVVAQFPSAEQKQAHSDRVYFRFPHAPNSKWLYTAGRDVEPVIVEEVGRPAWDAMGADERAGHVCFENMSVVDKMKYCDLPGLWDSRNWLCSVGANTDEFSTHCRTRTRVSSPMEFNLDTIVLFDTRGGTQAIQDENHLGASKPLAADHSRVKLLCADGATRDLTLYKRGDVDSSSRIPFGRNRICEDAGNVQIVFFRDGFYPVRNERSAECANWVNDGFLVGARAAVRNDSALMKRWDMKNPGDTLGYTGDYELCYFHEMTCVRTHVVSYLIAYVSMSFMRNAQRRAPAQTVVESFVNEGVYGAMNRYNGKKYYFDEEAGGDNAAHIKHFFFFDERETFVVADRGRPTGLDIEKSDERQRLMNHTAVQQARQGALNGKSRFLAVVCPDSSPTSNYGLAWHSASRDAARNRPYSMMRLNASAYHGVTGVFPDELPASEDGVDYTVFTMAHELGHATGNADEYRKRACKIGSYKFNSFDQFFECYTMDENATSMMYHNGIPRIHHVAYHLNKVNHESSSGDLRGAAWLNGKRFVGKYDFGAGSYTYTRYNAAVVIPASPRRPLREELKYRVRDTNPRKTLYLALYYVSQDESSSRWFHPGQRAAGIEYQGVLVVRVKIAADFAFLMTNSTRAGRISAINDAWKGLSCRYRLVGGTGAMANIIIHFETGFSGDDSPADRNYKASFNLTSLGSGSIVPAGATSDEIAVRRSVTGDELVAYFLNVADTTHLTNAAQMVNHLAFLRQWVNAQTGEAFALEAV
jgi:hypothetical protein